MSTIQSFFDSQLASEVKPYTTDFTDFIRSGASIASVSASYAQTLGGAASGSCAAGASSGSVTHISPALSAGSYTFTVTANMSNSDVRKAIWYVNVNA